MFITILSLLQNGIRLRKTTALNVMCEVEKTILISKCNADTQFYQF